MGLIVWLPLNGNLNNQGLKNITATTLETITYEKGKLGNAARIGTGSQVKNGISIDSNLVEDLGSEYSCSVWIKPTGNHVHYEGAILSSGDWNHTKWAFGVGQNNTTIDPFGPGYNYKLPCTIPTNEWTHLVSTVHNNIATVYKNGEQIGTYDFGNLVLDSDATNTTIGRETYANGYFGFNGCIEDVRIYNHCLSPREVKEISKGLVLHYPLAMPGQENMAVGTKNLSVTAYKSNMNCSKRGASTVRLNDYGFYESQVTNSFGGLCVYANQYNFQVGDTVTMSFYIYTNGSTKSYSFYPMMYNSSGTRDTSTGIQTSIDGGAYTTVNAKSFGSISSTVPERHYVTFIWNQNVKDIIDNGGSIELSIQIHGNWQTGDWGSIFGLKFERGSHPTPWIPNPSDTEYSTLGFNDGIEYDVSGYGNNGIQNNTPTFSSDTCKYTTSIHFDGVNQTVMLPNLATLIPDSIFTFNIWFKRLESEPSSKAWETILGGQSGFEIESCSSNSVHDAKIKAYSWGGGLFAFNFDKWNMLTMVQNGSNALFYLNGELKLTGTFKTLVSGNYFIGSWRDTTSQNYRGYMSDARIYSTALSADDILELYHTPISLSNNGTLLTQGEYVES